MLGSEKEKLKGELLKITNKNKKSKGDKIKKSNPKDGNNYGLKGGGDVGLKDGGDVSLKENKNKVQGVRNVTKRTFDIPAQQGKTLTLRKDDVEKVLNIINNTVKLPKDDPFVHLNLFKDKAIITFRDLSKLFEAEVPASFYKDEEEVIEIPFKKLLDIIKTLNEDYIVFVFDGNFINIKEGEFVFKIIYQKAIDNRPFDSLCDNYSKIVATVKDDKVLSVIRSSQAILSGKIIENVISSHSLLKIGNESRNTSYFVTDGTMMLTCLGDQSDSVSLILDNQELSKFVKIIQSFKDLKFFKIKEDSTLASKVLYFRGDGIKLWCTLSEYSKNMNLDSTYLSLFNRFSSDACIINLNVSLVNEFLSKANPITKGDKTNTINITKKEEDNFITFTAKNDLGETLSCKIDCFLVENNCNFSGNFTVDRLNIVVDFTNNNEGRLYFCLNSSSRNHVDCLIIEKINKDLEYNKSIAMVMGLQESGF